MGKSTIDNSLTFVSDLEIAKQLGQIGKDRAKEKESLIHLAAILKAVEEDVKNAKSGGVKSPIGTPLASFSTEAANGPTGNAFEDAMAQMVFALQMLQVKIAKFANEKGHFDQEIAKIQAKVAKKNLDDVLKKLDKVQAEQKTQEVEKFLVRLFEGIAAGILTVVAVVTAQPELLVPAILMIASATGLTDEATKGLASLFEDMGMSKEAAQIVAAIVVAVAIIVATVAFAPASAAADVADAATEIEGVVEGAAEIAEVATEVGETSSTFLSKMQKVFKTINLFNRLSAKANAVIMGTVQALSQTGLPTKIAVGIAKASHASEKERREVEQTVALITTLITVIVSLGSGAAMMGKGATTLSSGISEIDETTRFGKLVASLRQVSESGEFLKTIETARQATLLGQLGTGIASGVTTIDQGLTQEALGKVRANIGLNDASMDLHTTQVRESQRFNANTMRSLKLGNKTLSKLMAGEAAFANLFSHSPV